MTRRCRLRAERVRRGKKIRAAIASSDADRAEDLLNRCFTAWAPNRVWVTDVTYVKTWVGFVYIAFILDVFAQPIVAWRAATRKDVNLVETPLQMTLRERDPSGQPLAPLARLIHHFDPGSQ